VAADDHLGKSFSYYHLGARHRELHALGWDPGVRGSCYRAKSTWLLGYPEQDLKIAGTALALARELASPFHLAHASASLANHFASRGKIEEALQLANEAVILSSENGFAHWLALGTIVKGWALCRRGEITEGLGYFHEGLKNWQARGAQSVVPAILLRQAECYESAGQIDKALASVEEGLAVSDRIEDRLYYADLYRLKGELLLKDKKSGQVEGFSEVEKCILKAIDVSRHQKAKSYELRSVISLYRLRQKQGKAKLAHAILKKIYGWFTEGFASPDLREAKRLLDE
jgi:predicted ATPase